MEIFKGDTFIFDFGATLEDGTIYEFEKGDILKVGVKDRLSTSIYVLYKKIEIQETTEEIRVYFPAAETEDISEGDKILEVELKDTHGNVSTIYQEKIKVKGVVIND